MTPLKLTMRAFGPYAGETVIDFDKLDGRHLFLICGPTGAGKTTILDAMCYALYGKTSGDRTGSHMRSDYASTAQKTEVIFDFRIGDKTYRATRSPEQTIDKKRGKGQTRAAMQASLSELEEGREVRTIRTGVEEAAGKLIGLNAEEMTAKVAAGGPAAEEALGKTLDELRAIEDPVKRNAAGVALFGTQWEDMGNGAAVLAMNLGDLAGAWDDTAGASDAALQRMSDNTASAVESAKRSAEMAMNSVAGAVAARRGRRLSGNDWIRIGKHLPRTSRTAAALPTRTRRGRRCGGRIA